MLALLEVSVWYDDAMIMIIGIVQYKESTRVRNVMVGMNPKIIMNELKNCV